MTDKLYDLVAERVLAGWLISQPDHPYVVTRVVTIADFADVAARTAFGELSVRGYMTMQQLAAMHAVLPLVELRAWATDARHRDPKEIHALAVRVAERALARRVVEQAEDTIQDAHDPTVDAPELTRRVRARAMEIEAPEAPPADPALSLPEFMATGSDDYDWIVPDMIERSERVLLTATAGVGKTTFLRQVAVCAAAGINPFHPEESLAHPSRVLMIDLENSARHVRRKLRPVLGSIAPFDGERLHIAAHPRLIDVTTSAGYRWLFGQAALAKPDLVVCGPIYRFYEAGDASKDMGGRDKARRVAEVFDALRDRHNCALLIEAHPPRGSATLSPFGASLWEWWAEQGIGLKPDADGPERVSVVNWRYDRDDRHWPARLSRSSAGWWRSLDDGVRGPVGSIDVSRFPAVPVDDDDEEFRRDGDEGRR